jgi:IS30 family transposase
MTETYQQLTYEQRFQISSLKKRGCSQREIAETVGTSQSTVSPELATNTGGKGYRYKQAHEKSDRRRAEAVKRTKMTSTMINVIESKLRIEWSQ